MDYGLLLHDVIIYSIMIMNTVSEAKKHQLKTNKFT